MKLRLTVMWFLQFFIWGCWLTTLGAYMFVTLNFTGAQIGIIYSTLGIAALITPFIMGVIADRLINASTLYAICHLIGSVLLYLAAYATTHTQLFSIMLAYSLFYIPTIALSNSICYALLEKSNLFSFHNVVKVRVWGTVGFIVALWVVNLLQFHLSAVQLKIAAISSLLLSVYAFTIPKCPANLENEKKSLFSRLGLDALVLFKQPTMAVFFIFAMLIGVALNITNVFAVPFINDFSNNPLYANTFAVKYPSILGSIAQISEVLFILVIPFFLIRFGIKTVMLISIFAWVLRFGLFAYGTPEGIGFMLLLLSMIVYGCAFDFFNVAGSMFVDQSVPTKIRASAQGIYLTMTNGFGIALGSYFSGTVVDAFTVNGVKDWHNIWLTFSLYAALLFVAFALAFKYKHKNNAAKNIPETSKV